MGTAHAAILWKANATVRQEVPRFDLTDSYVQ
jgi:hypothetical protein